MNKNDAVRPINRRQAAATIVNTGYASGGVGSFRGRIIGFFFFCFFCFRFLVRGVEGIGGGGGGGVEIKVSFY